jgi:hypothetical protein
MGSEFSSIGPVLRERKYDCNARRRAALTNCLRNIAGARAA